MKGTLLIKLAIPVEVDTEHYDVETLQEVADLLALPSDDENSYSEHVYDIVETSLQDEPLDKMGFSVEVLNECGE